MKKGLLITILVCIGLIISGVIIFVIGIKNGGGMIFSIDYKNHRIETPENVELVKNEQELDEFDKLDITVATADLRIVNGDSYKVKYALYESETPTINVEDKTLKITPKVNKDQNNFKLSFFSDSDHRPYIEITVPEGTKLDTSKLIANASDITITDMTISEFDINVDAGDIKVNDSSIDTFKIDADAGDIHVTNVTSESFVIDADAGDINITDSTIGSYKLNVSSGDIDVKKSKIDSIDADVEYGDIEFELIGEEADYDFDIKIAYGDLEINDKDISNLYKSNNGKDKSIKINASSGDIDIDFK